MNWREVAKYCIPFVFIAGWMTPLLESEHISRTIGARYLFGAAGALGTVAGCLAAIPFSRYAELFTEPRRERLAWVLMFVVAHAMLFVALASLLNRAFPTKKTVVQTYEVVSKHYGGRGCLLKVMTAHGTEGFWTSPFVCEALNTKVQFVLSHGNLNFDRVIRVRSPQ